MPSYQGHVASSGTGVEAGAGQFVKLSFAAESMMVDRSRVLTETKSYIGVREQPGGKANMAWLTVGLLLLDNPSPPFFFF